MHDSKRAIFNILNTNVSTYYCILLKGSINQDHWVRLIDHTDYYCRSWQYLYFEPKVIMYIRIVGTNNTVNKASSFY